MTLDLLHEFANTEILGLFHNCMWQSRHPEVDVYLLELCEQSDRLFTSNGSPRSDSICVYVYVRRFPEHSNGTFVLNTSTNPLIIRAPWSISRATALKITANFFMCMYTFTCTFMMCAVRSPWPSTMVSCSCASRSCFKHFCRFQALTAQTDREEHVNNKHVQCVVHDQEGQRKATGQYLLSKTKLSCQKKGLWLLLLSNS